MEFYDLKIVGFPLRRPIYQGTIHGVTRIFGRDRVCLSLYKQKTGNFWFLNWELGTVLYGVFSDPDQWGLPPGMTGFYPRVEINGKLYVGYGFYGVLLVLIGHMYVFRS